MTKESKVFGIGFHKTGTKSLGCALSLLGYKVCGPFGTRDKDIAQTALKKALSLANHYDAFQDNPWPVLFRDLDNAFPNSKFVLTICPTDEWIKRTTRYFGTQETPMRQWIYGAGAPVGNETAYIQQYNQHNAEVKDYFCDRPNDLLVFPLTLTPSWEPLCNFLNKPLPQKTEFPHLNKRSTFS